VTTVTSQHRGVGAVDAVPASLPALDIAEVVRIRRFRPLRLLMGALVIAFVVFVLQAFANAQIDWSVVREYLFARITFVGLGLTVLMTVVAMVIGLSVAVLLAVGFGSQNPVNRWICKSYVWLFRGTPQLLQLLLWYNLARVRFMADR